MKILIALGQDMTIGGHFNTTQAWVRELKRRGHTIVVLSKAGPPDLIKPFVDAGAQVRVFSRPEFVTGRRFAAGGYLLGALEIARLLRRDQIDLVQLHDSPVLNSGYFAACLTRRPCVYLQAGGEHRNIGVPSKCELVVLSEEQRKGYEAEGICATVILARIDQEVFCPGQCESEVSDMYRLPANGRRLIAALRLEGAKKPWLDTIVGLVEAYGGAEPLHVALAGGGQLYSQIEKTASFLNARERKFGRLHLLGPIPDQNRMCDLYRWSDAFIGNGRGVMEAMSTGKPAFVVGEQGEVELIAEDNIEEIGNENFSGRHFRKRATKSKMGDELLQVFDDKLMCHCASFSLAYARANFSAAQGAIELETVHCRARQNRLRDLLMWLLRRPKRSVRAGLS
ncbi:glycosyltransferase [Thiorhodococcus minor]|uniref:Glycosyltransferase family 4 protein n=1 Tax=Thiorhodococcus minor TaxID=57489 RepID=A0A6M0K967_9GAMM|nr:glycosyltransferase [Thiorhodococcus minor]NEV65237.1 glycosyltransferase family 4 protein [Thiorhodococcus minor]